MQKSLGWIDKTDEATQNIDKKGSVTGPPTSDFDHRLHIIIYSASKMSLTGAKTDLSNGLPDQLPHTMTQNETAL